ncbi:MAG: DedA family protein [Bacteroidetes bacterium]|nr:MAG: DedA family protein [Bacteroidota bacterium]
MLDLLKFLVDFILHIDKHLLQIVSDYQTWTYLILFAIIFMETGFVVTPFLPGDSLLFAAGTIAAMTGNPLNIGVIVPLLIAAAFLGDNTNYFIGKFLGHQVYEKNYRLIKRKYLDQTHQFYEKHGRITIIIARFIPIIRTFAPFVAGVGTMQYIRFVSFSILGNILWVTLFSLAGYFFGNIPFIKNNFTLAILAIIFVSILPMIVAGVRKYLENRKLKSTK